MIALKQNEYCMNIKRSMGTRQTAQKWAASAVFILLQGCAASSLMPSSQPTIEFPKGPALPAAALPEFVVGESFTYNDGQSETVIAVRGDAVTWRSDQGVIRTRSRSFFLPVLSWQNSARRSQTVMTGDVRKMWPLKTGVSYRFDERQIAEDNDGTNNREYKRSWQCTVKGTEQVNVPAGSYDTYRIECYRYTYESSFWRQTRVYNFAPNLGYYVARDDTYASRPSGRRELVSAGFDSRVLSRADQSGLIEFMNKTMNTSLDGKILSWKSPSIDLNVQIKVLNTFAAKNGGVCRNYTSSYIFSGKSRSNQRAVCLRQDGSWGRPETQ